MDQRAQISIEYILLVGIIFLIVIVFGVVISDQSEQNNVATAAQLGASNATANIVFLNNTQSPVKVTSVDMSSASPTIRNVSLVIHFSGPISGQQPIIIESIENSLAASGFTGMTNTSSTIILNTNKHSYTISFS